METENASCYDRISVRRKNVMCAFCICVPSSAAVWLYCNYLLFGRQSWRVVLDVDLHMFNSWEAAPDKRLDIKPETRQILTEHKKI